MRIGKLFGASRGQSVVELAISLPLVMMLIMGVIDFGWVLYAHIQVAAASYEGARAGALFPGDWTATDAINQQARTQAVDNAIYNSSVTPPTSALGMLKTVSPYFDVAMDVVVSFPGAALNVVGQGQEMDVKVTYHQPVWFRIIPGVNNATGTFGVSTTTKVRIQ